MTELRDITTALAVAMEACDQPLTNELLVTLITEVGDIRANRIVLRIKEGLSPRARTWWDEDMQPTSTVESILRDGFEAALAAQRRKRTGR